MRSKDTNWADWNIPLHWGGMSDPFQPCEKTIKASYEALKVFAETQYPFLVSTKGALIADDDYIELLEKCNCVVQISAVCSQYDKLELGCPTYEQRLKMIKKIAPRVKRVIVRCQPYMHEVFNDVYSNIERIKNAGAYGIIIEGMKYTTKRAGLVKLGGDYVYPYDIILSDFMKLKDRAHEVGLKIYAGENRIRKYGDSLTCCGCDGLEGFDVNTFNLNHLLNGDKTFPREKMQELKTGSAFASTRQDSLAHREYDNASFAYSMLSYYKKNKTNVNKVFGIIKV